MQRKPGFPVANSGIKMPDNMCTPSAELFHGDDDPEQQQRRQQLINFGHAQWGFNNWSWTVTKQELDFVDFTNGKYCAGVVAFVSVNVKSLDIHRENIGYATSLATSKGFAIYKSRKEVVAIAAAVPAPGDPEEEARAERKRRQRQAQEEFRQKQLLKQKGLDDKHELHKNSSGFDKLLMELPSQDIVIQETGDLVADTSKRKSPGGDGGATKRRQSVINRLDIVEAD